MATETGHKSFAVTQIIVRFSVYLRTSEDIQCCNKRFGSLSLEENLSGDRRRQNGVYNGHFSYLYRYFVSVRIGSAVRHKSMVLNLEVESTFWLTR